MSRKNKMKKLEKWGRLIAEIFEKENECQTLKMTKEKQNE